MKKSFALKAQIVMIFLLLASFVMMAQPCSQQVFVVGITLLIVAALLQVAIGNINLSYGPKQWLKSLLNILVIVEQVVLASLLLSPYFLKRQFIQAFLLVLIIGTAGLFALFIIKGSGTNSRTGKEGGYE